MAENETKSKILYPLVHSSKAARARADPGCRQKSGIPSGSPKHLGLTLLFSQAH